MRWTRRQAAYTLVIILVITALLVYVFMYLDRGATESAVLLGH